MPLLFQFLVVFMVFFAWQPLLFALPRQSFGNSRVESTTKSTFLMLKHKRLLRFEHQTTNVTCYVTAFRLIPCSPLGLSNVEMQQWQLKTSIWFRFEHQTAYMFFLCFIDK